MCSMLHSVPVYAHPAIFGDKYSLSKKDDRTESRFIGIPQRRELLEARGAHFQLDTDLGEVGEGLFLTGEIPRVMEFEAGEDRLKVKLNDVFTVDSFPDDGPLFFQPRRDLLCSSVVVTRGRSIRSNMCNRNSKVNPSTQLLVERTGVLWMKRISRVPLRY